MDDSSLVNVEGAILEERTQAALGPAQSDDGGRKQWDCRTLQLAVVCEIHERAHAARVKLLNHPSVEIKHVPMVRTVAPVIGEHVLVQWIGGHVNNPVVVAVADTRTKEQSIATKRPMVDIVGPTGGGGRQGRHIREYPLQLLALPTGGDILATQVYVGQSSWESYMPGGEHLQVFGQYLPHPLDADPEDKSIPPDFRRVYHQTFVSATQGVHYRQIATPTGANAWRVTQKLGAGNTLEMLFQWGRYKTGSVQDWEPLGTQASVTIDAAGKLTVKADTVVVESNDVRMAQQTRPVLVASGDAPLPAGVVEATEVKV